MFLPESKQRIEQQQRRNDCEIAPVAYDECHQRRGFNHPRNGGPEVAGQSGKRTLLFFHEGVWPVRFQSRLNLGLGQTRLRIGSALRRCLGDGWASRYGDIWGLHYSLLLSQ